MNRDIIEEARRLCDEIAGECCDDDSESRGSIQIVTVLVNEVNRLREVRKCAIGKFTLSAEKDLYSGKDVTVIRKDGEAGSFDTIAVECAIGNFFNANL